MWKNYTGYMAKAMVSKFLVSQARLRQIEQKTQPFFFN